MNVAAAAGWLQSIKLNSPIADFRIGELVD